MSEIKIGKGWLITIFLSIALALAICLYNDSRTLSESTYYTDRRISEQKVYTEKRTVELREEYLGIARQQAISNRYLILLTCTAKKTLSECKREQEELDQYQTESQLRNE